jgi:hypothetical protein
MDGTTSSQRHTPDLLLLAVGTKIYGNNLFAGDVLAGEDNACTINAGVQQFQPKPPPTANPRVTQQRALSAQVSSTR